MSIGCTGSTMASNQFQGAARAQRPDPAQLAQKLFLQAALDKVTLSKEGLAASSATTTDSGTSVDALMAKLDGNGDGKITEQEFADALSNAAQQMRGHRGHHAHGAHGRGHDGDHDGDGDDAAGTAGTVSSSGTSTASTRDSDGDGSRALMQVMRMLRAYQAGDATTQPQAATTTQGASTQGAANNAQGVSVTA